MAQIQDIKPPGPVQTVQVVAHAPAQPATAVDSAVSIPPKKKKILYLVTKSNFGGAQKYVYDLATHVPSEYEAVVMTGKPQLAAQSSVLLNKLAEKNIRTIEVS